MLVTGGSQGARALNELVPRALSQLGRELQVVHLSGLGNDAEVRQRYMPVLPKTVARLPLSDRVFAAAILYVRHSHAA